jgi:RNA polymerase sigma-70 factor (ECF subfamily)
LNLIDIIKGNSVFRKKICESRSRLYRTVYSWCHDPDVADDVVQQTLYKALQNYQQVNEVAALNGWLFKILARTFSDHYRSHKEYVVDDELHLIDDHTPENAATEQQIVRRVRDAIKRIPLEQRQVVTLVDLERFSYAEVANIMSIPVGTVMSRLSRARQTLHKYLNVTKKAEDGVMRSSVRRVK